MQEKILILDFGGQYNQLIARRVREQNVYCEVKPYTTTLDEIRAFAPMGIIFTGGPNSVYLEESPHVDPEVFRLGVPILGICYGCQLMAHTLGGQVTAAQEDTAREYGKTVTYYDTGCKLFKGIPEQAISWMSHGDYMAKVPEGFALVAHTDACPNAAIADESRGFYGVQFHPEVNHTQFGSRMLRNFLYEICGAKGTWTMGDFCKNTVAQLRDTIGPKGRVLLALSGGVDSSVLAALLAEAVGDRLTAVFVDHGCMRQNEGDEVEAAFAKWNIHFVRVDAEKRFLDKLKGVEDPQRKRQIIGAEFGYVFLDGETGEDRSYKVEGNSVLAGMHTTAQNGENLEEISAFMTENKDRYEEKKLLLYGNIPGLCYYLDKPSAVYTSWADLDTNPLGRLEEELKTLTGRPLVIITPQLAAYFSGDRKAMEYWGTDVEGCKGDQKLSAILQFMREQDYRQVFANEAFIIYE